MKLLVCAFSRDNSACMLLVCRLYMDIAFTVVFLWEAVMKVIAHGWSGHRKAYWKVRTIGTNRDVLIFLLESRRCLS